MQAGEEDRVNCPKCRKEPLRREEHDGVEVDRCQQCKGLWFDAGELESIKGMAAAVELDSGDIETGKHHDAMRIYDCPRCGGTMTSAIDPRQPIISFETCQDCQGSFLDAGELTRSMHGEPTAT